jgi:tetratricopeptide (TPR) repeat protein
MTLPAAEIGRRLAAGEDILDIRRSLLPAPWVEVMKVCAAAHTFDERTYGTILTPAAAVMSGTSLADLPDLAELHQRKLVDRVTGRLGLYQLCEPDRRHFLRRWQSDTSGPAVPAALAALARHLADDCARSGQNLDRLRHEILADTGQAIELFTTAFDEARRRRDFPRMQDLLDVVSDRDRVALAGPRLSELVLDRAAYLRALRFWSDDYGHSAQFFAEPGLHEQVEALLRPDGPRAWHLFGPGGMGKTIRLQWLVARQCSGDTFDVPCARLDLDMASPAVLGQYPWLALLPLAEQLDLRSPRPTFDKIKDRYGELASLLTRQPSELALGAAQTIGTPQVAVAAARDIPNDFIRHFNAVAGDRPAVVVVDTLEELLLEGEHELASLLLLLGRVHRRCPALRIVLSGRYDLRARGRVRAAVAAFDRIEHIELKPFDESRARAYLRETRGLADSPLLDVVVRQSCGVPFSLALYADLLENDVDITEGVLAANREPRLMYVIDRIVRRVDDVAVRWLLRYGVIPRRLRFEDVATVMRPFLARGMAGPSADDDPRDDRHHRRGDPNVFPFRSEPLDDAALRQIWDRLRAYIGTGSWVYQPPGDMDTVVFHPNARAPMRQLVSGHPVFADLHRAFAEHFANLAERDDAQWSRYLRESLYHKFQLRDATAVDDWRAAVHRCRRGDDLDRLVEIAREIRGEDYLDEDGRPRTLRTGEPVVDLATVAEAWLYEAYATVRRAIRERVEPTHPYWGTADVAWRRAGELGALAVGGATVAGSALLWRAGAAVAGDAALGGAAVLSFAAVVGSAILLRDGAVRDAERFAAAALDVATTDEDRAELWEIVGDCRAARSDPPAPGEPDTEQSANAAYRGALRAATAAGWQTRAVEIMLALADDSRRRGDFDTALEWCERAREGIDGALAASVDFYRIEVLLRRCEPARAARVATETARQAVSPADRAAAARLEARAEHLLGHTTRALRCLDKASEHAQGIAGTERWRHLAEADQLRGAVQGELLLLGQASDSFSRAASLWSELGFATGNPEWRLLYGTFLVRQVRDAAQAIGLLPDPAALAPDADETTVRTWLVAVEAAALAAGEPDEEQLVQARRFVADRRAAPDLAALVAAHTLTLTDGRARDLTSHLESRISRLRPASAQGYALLELAGCPQPADPGTEWARLRRTARRQLDQQRTFRRQDSRARQDHALSATAVAEVDRLVWGSPTPRVPASLDAAIDDLARDGDALLARWRWLQARARLADTESDHPHAAALLTESRRHPLLRAAALGLLADTAVARGRRAEASRLLAEAVELQQNEDVVSGWAAENLTRYATVNGDRDAGRRARDMYTRLGVAASQRSPRAAAAPADVNAAAAGVLPDRPWEAAVRLEPPRTTPLDRDELQRQMQDNLPGVIDALRTALIRRIPDSVRRTPGTRRAEPITTLRLESDDAVVQMLPWELAAEPAEFGSLYRSLPLAASELDVRWLQATLNRVADAGLAVDGIPGPLTRHALDRFQRAAHANPDEVDPAVRDLLDRTTRHFYDSRSVIVVSPAADVEAETRVAHWSSGHDVTLHYERFGFRVHTPDIRALRETGPPVRDVAVLHLNARLHLIGDTPYLDLSGDDQTGRLVSRSSGSDLRPRDVAALLRHFPRGREPVVVLDPPFPGSLLDIPWQLLLRNLFAAQMFQTAAAPAIIATGLGPTNSSDLTRLLASGLREGRSLLSLVTEASAGAPQRTPGSSDDLASRATTIFAAASAITRP